MRFPFKFEDYPVARAWPAEITASGEFDIEVDADGEWGIGEVRVAYYRQGEHVLDVVPPKARAQRIRNWAITNAIIAGLIDEMVGETLENAPIHAAVARYDDARASL